MFARALQVAFSGLVLVLPVSAQCPPVQPGVIHVVGVPKPFELNAAAFAQMTRAEVQAEGHGLLQSTFSGIPLRAVLTRAGVPEGRNIRGKVVAQVVVIEAADNYRATYALAEADSAFTDRVILIADRMNGKPLTEEYGPFQIIVPGEKRHARWVRQVTCIRVVELSS